MSASATAQRTEAVAPERRRVLRLVQLLNLGFLAVDLALYGAGDHLVLAGRLLVSAALLAADLVLSHVADARALRSSLVASILALVLGFALLAAPAARRARVGRSWLNGMAASWPTTSAPSMTPQVRLQRRAGPYASESCSRRKASRTSTGTAASGAASPWHSGSARAVPASAHATSTHAATARPREPLHHVRGALPCTRRD